jgi:hypothetical protein
MKLTLCCLLVVLAHSCLGQDPTSMLGKFQLIDRDIPSIKPEMARNPVLRKKISRTLAAWEKFQPVVKHPEEWHGGTFAESYGAQLAEDQQSIHKIVSNRSFSKRRYLDTDRVFEAALDDLYLKVNACLLNGGKAVGSVAVTVHTKKSGVEVPNWRVVCMAKILRLYPNSSPTTFPQLSSPTKWDLAPGNYIMWAEDPDTGKKSRMQEIPVDRDQECDLAVP